EGVCIGRSGGGLNESFTVRKISYGEGGERVFAVMSPMIDSIKVALRGSARVGLTVSFAVRKISYGEGVERVFPVMSPMIDSIKVVRRGKVRRAKLYYLRQLRCKSAHI